MIWKKVVRRVRQGYALFVWLLGEPWRVFHTACCEVIGTGASKVTEIGIMAQIPLPQPRKRCLYSLFLPLSFRPQWGMIEENQIYSKQYIEENSKQLNFLK